MSRVEKIMSSATRLIVPVLCSLFIGGCGQIIRETMPPQLGGTGRITLYDKETQGQSCALSTKLQYIRYPTGLGSPVGEQFAVSVFNHTKQTYGTDIQLTGVNQDTGEIFRKEIGNNVLLFPRENGPPYGAVHEDLELPVANWRKYNWTVEIPNCRVVTAQEDPRLTEPRQIIPGVCSSFKPCLLMTVNLSKGVMEESTTKVQRDKANGSLHVKPLVKGRWTQAISTPELNYLSLTFDRKKRDCPGSMEDVLPVLGFSPEGYPLIATGSGEFLITDERVAVGCRDCIELIDPENGNVVYRADSPGRNLGKLGYELERISFDNQGAIYVKHIFADKTSVCVRTQKNGRFEWGGLFDCAPSKTANIPVSVSPTDRPEITQWTLTNARSKYLMRLNTETCP